MSDFNIHQSKNLTDMTPEKYGIIKCFINYCVDKLAIESPFNVYLCHSNDPNKPNMSLACFMIDSNDIWVRADGRIAMDINRSFAHELEHLKQKETGALDDMSGYTDVGGTIEDEANAVAGQLCKLFINEMNCKFVYNV